MRKVRAQIRTDKNQCDQRDQRANEQLSYMLTALAYSTQMHTENFCENLRENKQ